MHRTVARSAVVRAFIGLTLLSAAFFGACASGAPNPVSSGVACAPNSLIGCVCADGVTQGTAMCSANAVLGACMPCSSAPGTGGAGAAGVGAAGLGSAGSGVATAGTGAAGTGAAGMRGVAGAGVGAAGASAAGMGAAGRSVAGAGAAGTGSAGAAAATGCAAGEMCKSAPAGGGKFCSSDPAATAPPTCTAVNKACGTNGKGSCVDGTAFGYAGMMFCIYSSC